ncbi:MAG TPA: hypothetical protein VEW69_12460 [Alphaproteobacteria bacterium]|nr:hypothetical protein [Alphaproteobacteria bacterium]
MNQHWILRSVVITSFAAFMLPLSATVAPADGDPCKQMHRALDLQIDNTKAKQEDELQECRENSGKDSDTCVSLRDQQKQYLQSLRANRKGRLAACQGSPALAATSTLDSYNYDTYYQNRGNCEAPYVNCAYQEQRYVRRHHHHHHSHSAAASGEKSASTKPSSSGGQVSGGKSGKDSSTAKISRGAGSSGSSGHANNSGSYSGSSRSSDNGSYSRTGSSYSGSSGQSSSADRGSSYSGSSSGSSVSGSSSPSRDTSSSRDAGASRPK